MAETRVTEDTPTRVLDAETLTNMQQKQPALYLEVRTAIRMNAEKDADGRCCLKGEIEIGDGIKVRPAEGHIVVLDETGELTEVKLPLDAGAEKKIGNTATPETKQEEEEAQNKQNQAVAAAAERQDRQAAELSQQQGQKGAPAQAPTVTINPFGGIGGMFSGLREAIRRDPKTANAQFQAMAASHAAPAAAPVAEAPAAPKSAEQRLATIHGAGQQVLQAVAAVDEYTRNLGVTKPWSELDPKQRAALMKDPVLQTRNQHLTDSIQRLDKALSADPKLVDAVGRAAGAPDISEEAKKKLLGQLQGVYGKGGTVDKAKDALGKRAPRLNPNSEEGRAAQKMLEKLQKIIEEVAKKIEQMINGLFGRGRARSAAPGA